MIYIGFNLFRNRNKGTRVFTRGLFSEGMVDSQAYILLSRKCVIPVVCVKIEKGYVVKYSYVT